MWLIPLKRAGARLGVVLLSDRLAVAALAGERLDTFSIAAENPAAALRDELTNRGLTPRTVALAVSRSAVFVRPMEVPAVGGDMREVVRLNLDGHLPFTAEETAFDFVPLPAEAEGTHPQESLHRVLVAAAEPRIVESALRIAEEARLRPTSLTVAAHDLLGLVAPERSRRIVWVHRTGASADVLCLYGPALVLSRAVPAPDDTAVVEEVRRSLGVVRWRACDAVWISGDLASDAPALSALTAPVSAPAYTSRARDRLATLPAEDQGAHELALAVVAARRSRPLDLLPPALRPRRLTRAQGFTLGVAAATALLLVAALLVRGYREERHLARINAEITRLEPQVRTAERLVRDLERKRKLLTTINGIESAALRPLPVLRELTELLPTDTWLTTLSLDQKGVEVTGQAAAASGLIPLLENSSRLERVEFSSPVTRGRDKEQFRIRATWETGAAQAAGAATRPTPGQASPRPGSLPPGGVPPAAVPPVAPEPGQAPGPPGPPPPRPGSVRS
jgi:Tfp pilus assembly protein PilN